MNQKDRFEAIRGYAARLKFPHVFLLVVALLVLDVLIPDPIPFVDEIVLIVIGFLLNRAALRRLGWWPSTSPPDENQGDQDQQ